MYPQFRMNNNEDIKNYLRFDNQTDPNVISFEIKVPNNPIIKLIHVGNKLAGQVVDLPQGKEFRLLTNYTNGNIFGIENVSNKINVLKKYYCYFN